MSVASIKRLTPFTPTQISGCQLWFDGADPAGTGVLPANNATVSTWADKSGNGRNGTASGTPAYSSGRISFNGSSSYTLPDGNYISGSGSYTMFSVQTTNNPSSVEYFYSFGPVAQHQQLTFVHAVSPNPYLGWNNNDYTYRYSMSSNVSFLATNTYNLATNLRYGYINGNLDGSNTPSGARNTQTSPNYIAIGPNNFPLNGTISEIVVFSTFLTTAQQQQVDGYLAQKWGFTGSLPPFHPGLKNKIYPSIPQNRLFNLITSSAFTPLTITGCALWLDASDSSTVTGTSSVTAWNDKSGNGRNTTTTGTISYANSGISITSSSSYLTGSFGSPDYTGSTVTCFLIASMSSSSGSVARPLSLGKVGTQDWNNLASINIGRGGGLVLRTYRNVQTLASPPSIPAYDTRFLATSGQTSSAIFMSINGGTLSTEALSGAFAINAYRIGHDLLPDDLNEQFNGVMNEILVYFLELTIAQRQQIEGYLAWKWGLQANLPANHPYKSAAPTSTSTAPARAIISLPRFQYSSSGLVITHLDGRSWKLSGSSIYLNTGTTMSLTIYAGSDVYNSANGRVGLFNNGSSSAAVRHSSYVMFADPFTPNNFDFAWYFVSSGSGYLIYNDYPSISAWQVSYDTGQDRVLITPPGSGNYGMVWNITPKLTLSYVYRSYPT